MRTSDGATSSIGWLDAVKLGWPVVVTIIVAAITLYVKVETSTTVMSARLLALEDAVKLLPSDDVLEAYRIVSDSRISSLEDRLRRVEGQVAPR